MSLKEFKRFEPLTHLDYEQETFSETENAKVADSLNDKQESEKDWKPVSNPSLDVLKDLEKPIQAIKTGFEVVYTPVEAVLSVLETISGFLGKATDPIKAILEPIRDQISELIDKLGGTGGVHLMYKLPIDLRGTIEQIKKSKTADEQKALTEGYEQASLHQTILNSSQKMDKFWKEFETSFQSDNFDKEVWIPNFKPDEYVVGYCILILLPSYKEAYETLQKILGLFSVPLLPKHEIDGAERDLARLEASMYYTRTRSFISEKKFNGIRIKWSRYRFPHKILIKNMKFKDLKSGELTELKQDDIEILNNGPEWNLDTSDFEILNFDYGREYYAAVELYVQESVYNDLTGRSLEVSEIAGYGINRTPVPKTPFENLIARQDVKIKTPFVLRADEIKGKFYGDAAEGEWFGASIDTLLPQITKLKQNLKTIIDSIFDQMVEKVTAVERISKAITKKIEKITTLISGVRNQIYAVLDKFVVDLSGGAIYTKHIPLQLGGTEQFIKDVKNIKGIDQKWLIDSNFATAVFLMGGGKDAFQVETIIDLLKLFVPQDDGESSTAEMAMELDPYTESGTWKESFDLTGIDNEYKPSLTQPFGG